MKVLFVCTGNTCRSPMAEGILNELSLRENLDFEASSAGITAFDGGPASQNSILAMDEIQIDIASHRARRLNQKILDENQLILTMSRSHKDIIKTYFEAENVYGLNEYALGQDIDIKDPFSMDLNIYRETRKEIERAVENLIKKIDI